MPRVGRRSSGLRQNRDQRGQANHRKTRMTHSLRITYFLSGAIAIALTSIICSLKERRLISTDVLVTWRFGKYSLWTFERIADWLSMSVTYTVSNTTSSRLAPSFLRILVIL